MFIKWIPFLRYTSLYQLRWVFLYSFLLHLYLTSYLETGKSLLQQAKKHLQLKQSKRTDIYKSNNQQPIFNCWNKLDHFQKKINHADLTWQNAGHAKTEPIENKARSSRTLSIKLSRFSVTLRAHWNKNNSMNKTFKAQTKTKKT